jgi:hypothetical protein
MPTIWRSDAILTYSFATDAIRFPERTEGIEAITRVLVVDFAQRYRRCKTYYIEDYLREQGDTVQVPWLVAMREVAAESLRLGRGYYRWTFTGVGAQRGVSAMHIHIDRMELNADPQASLLEAVQLALPYPWLTSSTMRRAFRALIDAHPRYAFLAGVCTPTKMPE